MEATNNKVGGKFRRAMNFRWNQFLVKGVEKRGVGEFLRPFQDSDISILGGGNSNTLYFHPDPWENDPM